MIHRPAFVYHPDYEINIGKHVFPTEKFRLYKEALIELRELSEEEIHYPERATEEELLSVLTPEYLDELNLYKHTPRTIQSELPISRNIVEGVKRTAGGTTLAARLALEHGACIHIGGGFHHGFHDHAEGFCYINDVAIAAKVMIDEKRCRKVAIIDTDVHQGNGTAKIFEHEERVFTFSIHQDLLYPRKETSDLDVGCHVNIRDEKYLNELRQAMAFIVGEVKPDLAIIVAGVDPYENDKLGELNLSWEGMRLREIETIRPLRENLIPFVTVTGGGYSRDLRETVGLHVQTAQVALELCREYPFASETA